MDQEIGDLEVARLRGELFDGVAAVAENSLAAIDKGDFAGTRCRGCKSWIVREIAESGLQILNVQSGFTFRSGNHR
ncbi:hypothetical protein D3C83_154910 [compost metagenome]